MVGLRWTVVPAEEFWENLSQVMACDCFRVVSYPWYDKRYGGGFSETYEVHFSDSDGPQKCDVFGIYYGKSVVYDKMVVSYMVDESKLSMLAAIAAIDSLMGDVVPVS